MRYLLIFLLFRTSFGFGQDTIKCFVSTGDFVKKNAQKVYVSPVIEDIEETYLDIPKMLNKAGKRDKLASSAWAILYKKNYYINLRYYDVYVNSEVYVKPKIIGKYVAVVIDVESSNLKRLAPNANYGLGLSGVILSEIYSEKSHYWVDSTGIKYEIVIFNTSEANQRHMLGHMNAMGELLTRKRLRGILGKEFNKETINLMSYEDAIVALEQENLDSSTISN